MTTKGPDNRFPGDEEDPRTNSRTSSVEETVQGRQSRNKKVRIILLVLVVLGVVAGVVFGVVPSSSDSDDNDSVSVSATETPSPTTINATITPAPTAATIISPVQRQIRWVLAAVNGEEELTSDSIAEHFSELFRSQISDNAIIALFQSLSDQNKGEKVKLLESFGETDYSAVVLVGSDTQESREDEQQWQMTLVVVEKPPYLINGLLFQEPPKGIDVIPQSLSELADQVKDLAASSSTYFVAEIVDGKCSTISGSYNQDSAVPLGSTFKLYVLGALAQSIIAGDLTWMDELAIRDDLKSLPSGTMQNEAAGTLFTLLEYAQRMIQNSDNTATDHLIDLLGRERVEVVQTDLGHHNASLNVPFLTTGELFRIKAGLNDNQTTEYVGLDVERKRQFLENLPDRIDLDSLDLSVFSSPRLIHLLEWFATPNDICRAYVSLGDLALDAGEDEMQSILEFDQNALNEAESSWEFIGYKGGSEPGVIMVAFVAARTDGRRFVQVLSLADPEQRVDERTAFQLAIVGLRLLAKVP